MIAGWSKLCTWFMGWLLLALLSVQCFSLGVHQGRHSATLLGSELVQTTQAAPCSSDASRVADDGISEGSCSFCQVQKISTGIQFAAPDFASLGPFGWHSASCTVIFLPFKVGSSFVARAPPLI